MNNDDWDIYHQPSSSPFIHMPCNTRSKYDNFANVKSWLRIEYDELEESAIHANAGSSRLLLISL
jgi:hypothetical protein